MSIISDICAEHHRKIVKEAVERAQTKADMLIADERALATAKRLLQEVLEDCELQIQE
jgi:hypothetical protein